MCLFIWLDAIFLNLKSAFLKMLVWAAAARPEIYAETLPASNLELVLDG